MDWLLTNPQMHSTFSSLGSFQNDIYVVNSDALVTLEEINFKLSCEDQILRTYRRAIGFGQKVKLDLIPLLIHAKDAEIVNLIIRILVNLTIPVECLFSVDLMYRTETGRQTIFEINNLLLTSKEAFTDSKCTKVVIDNIKSILESDVKLSQQKCESINNSLILLRNILHIPEHNAGMILQQGHYNGGNGCTSSMQNLIIWNLFIQSIDKLLIHLMTCSHKSYWGVTMVQLIAIMYKDQHVGILQKLLSVWFEASLSESSEDNESNTSPPKQGSGDSSPMLTSDPTSDSSDTGSIKPENTEDHCQTSLNMETEQTLQQVFRKGHEYQNAILRISAKQQLPGQQSNNKLNQVMAPPKLPISEIPGRNNIIVKQDSTDSSMDITTTSSELGDSQQEQTFSSSEIYKAPFKSPHCGNQQLISSGKYCAQKRECPSSQSELSDCGYGTQVENQESISTSSNDDDSPHQKPVHQKPPCNQKQRKMRTAATMQDKKEWRRKKLVKRSKSNLISMKGLVQHIPTDDDISNILKEFTVDFLLKGYGHLVQDLHTQLLFEINIQMDTSHFFWLITYFLKFAAQLELDLEHINSVLCFDIISYLTYEGVTLNEQLDLTSRQQGSDLKPFLRRLHLVVTAIREFLQALETYKKITHLSKEDCRHLGLLQVQIASTEDLRCLFVLLIRTYNPAIHSKQFLQDLIVTNHILLLLLDNSMKLKENNKSININMMEHIAQFASVEMMHHYGLLLEDFYENGEFINDCVFTMMHHVSGDLEQISTLFQPVILKTFSRIWEAEYEVCDDWSDLIEYIIHKFMNTPQKSPLTLPITTSLTEITKEHNMELTVCNWNQEEMDTLYWYYVQSKKSKDVVGKILSLFHENGDRKKSRISIIQQLLQQDIITLVEYDDLMKFEDAEYQRTNAKTPALSSVSTGESGIEIKDNIKTISKPSDDIKILKDRLLQENKGNMLFWLQKVLIECCFIKLTISKSKTAFISTKDTGENIQIMEPILYHCILQNKSIPLVAWNCEQSSIMTYQPFVLLLHKLGFHLPADTGKIYLRIPDFWTAELLYHTAEKLGPINKSFLKFDLNLLGIENSQNDSNIEKSTELSSIMVQNKNVDKEGQNSSVIEEFNIPNKIKRSNSIIRFTPDPSSTPLVPNWLQLVMKSKCPPAPDSSNSAADTSIASHTKLNTQQTSCIPTDEDAISMKSINNSSNKYCNNGSKFNLNKILDNKYSAMVASVYECENSNYETESVASDLTRMYVSDEDDNQKIS